eukprot:gene8927-1268_t
MKALILAAGYGTRLQRDIERSATYKILSGIPKPLLPIVIVVTNASNHSLFEVWAENFPSVKLVCEGSTANENRSGAVAAIAIGASTFSFSDDLIVIGGDTLFKPDFDLQSKIKEFYSKQPCSLLLSYNVNDEATKKCGILEINSQDEVTAFLEKPGPEKTSSRLGCPCFYIFEQPALALLNPFLDKHIHQHLSSYDAPGNFIRYLVTKRSCIVRQISGRYDVGGLSSYLTCDQEFSTTSLCHLGLAFLVAIAIRLAMLKKN